MELHCLESKNKNYTEQFIIDQFLKSLDVKLYYDK